MNSKIIGHYCLEFPISFLEKLIIKNQIFLQTYSLNETVINNGENCDSIIFFPKITTGLIQMFGGINRDSMNHQICNASARINILFILAFLIYLSLFFFFWKQRNLIETVITPIILFIIIAVLIKILEILIYGF